MSTPLKVELFYSSSWNDITSDVRADDQVVITRGRGDGLQRVSPTQCQLSLNNHTAKYSPRNPNSSLFGLIGRNTPIRCWYRLFLDDFGNRTQSGWGFASDGRGWSSTGVGTGSLSVGSGVGVHTQTTAAGYLFSFLTGDPENLFRNVEIRTRFTPQLSNVTGGSIEPGNLVLRFVDIINYYFARVEITTAEAVQVSIRKLVANVDSAVTAAVDTGIAFTGQELAVALFAEGSVLGAKVWDPTDGEPLDWQVIGTDTTFPDAGPVGVRTGVASGNTNVPVTVNYDDLELRSDRFIGEVESWPVRSSGSGKDIWSPIVAYGVTHRLGNAGTKNDARSALTRAISADTTGLLAWWPFEDGIESTAPQPYPGFGDAGDVTDAVTYRPGDTGPPGARSAATGFTVPLDDTGSSLPQTFDEDGLNLDIPDHTNTGEYTIGFAFYWDPMASVKALDGSTYGNTNHVIRFQNTTDGTGAGTVGYLRILFETNSSDPQNVGQLNIYTKEPTVAGLTVTDQLPFTFSLRQWHYLRITLEQQGTDFEQTVYLDGVQKYQETSLGSGYTLGKPMVLALGTAGFYTNATATYAANQADFAISHVTIYNSLSASDFSTETQGHAGEEAGDRADRLGDEESITVTVRGSSSQAMGAQQVVPALESMFEAAETDGGVLLESRPSLGLDVRLHEDLYDQTAAATLDYDEEEVWRLEPSEDTDRIANVTTVVRRGGGETTIEKPTGWLNTSDPTTDVKGVGRYPTRVELSVDTDAQTEALAARRLRAGTWDEPYWPVVGVNIAKLVADDKAGLVNDLLAADVGDVLAIDNPPDWAGPSTVKLLADGYVETVGSHTHTIEFNGGPAGPYLTRGLDLPGTSGNYASTPDTAVLDITGDLDLRAEVTLDDYTTGATQTLVGKYATTGNQRSYRMYVNGAGNLSLAWSTDGTGTNVLSEAESLTSVAVDGERIAVRATIDVDNGASNYTVKFYTAPCIDGPWTQLGAADDHGSATTSIFSGTAALEVGSITGGTGDLAAGIVHAVQVFNGIDGTKVVDVRFQEQTPGDTSFVDDAGRTWTVHGTAEIV